MNPTAEITKWIAASRQELFRYFTDRALMEKWAAPSGLTLRLPVFEPRPGGRYRYEHTGKDGTFVAEGGFREVSPERIVQHDWTIRGPDGHELHHDLDGVIELTEKNGGTEVHVLQTGFAEAKDAQDCETGWRQCLENLAALVAKDPARKVG